MRITIFITLCVIILIAMLFLPIPKEKFDDKYEIIEIKNFLTSEECDIFIELAKKKGLEQSMVYGDANDLVDKHVRKSEQAWLYDSDDEHVAKLSLRIANIIGIPVSHQEAAQVVHYHEGGMYNLHFDPCEGDEVQCIRMNKTGGPRYITFIVYLNDNFEGGGTDFPNIPQTLRPERGKAAIFKSIDPHTHEILSVSQHAALPIENGEKWIINKWIHVYPYV